MRNSTKVELVGVFPTIFSTACKAICNPMGLGGVFTSSRQLSEYPADVVQNMKDASRIFSELTTLTHVEVKSVQAYSFRGLWLSIRMRLGRGLWVVVDGNTALDARAGPTEIRRMVKRLRDEAIGRARVAPLIAGA